MPAPPRTPCVAGEVRNRVTKKCRARRPSGPAPRTPCSAGQIRNRKTRACRDRLRAPVYMSVLDAFMAKNLKALTASIAVGKDVNETDEEGYTALLLALVGNREEYLKEILKGRPNLEYEGPEGTALEMAMNTEDTKQIRTLVEAGASIDKKHKRGQTYLHKLAYDINFTQVANPRRSEHLKEVLLSLLHPGMNVNIKDDSGRTAIDILFEGGYFDLLREVLYNAGASETDPTFRFAHDTTDTKYIFAQRGASCGPDAYFTFLLFSDATREPIRRAIPDILSGDAVLNTYTHMDLLANGFDNAIIRYTALRELRAKARLERPDRIRRLPTPTMKCEDLDMKRGITNDEGTTKEDGITPDDIIRSSQVILRDNKYELFPRGDFLEFFKFDLDEGLVADLRTLDIRRVVGMYIGLEPVLTSREMNAAERLGGSIPSGHAIALFKYKNRWVLSDDTSGLLHVFRDARFIDDHLLPTLRDDTETIRVAYTPIYDSLKLAFDVPGATYPNISPLKRHMNWKYKFGSGVVFLRA
jgi:hypothetical protein